MNTYSSMSEKKEFGLKDRILIEIVTIFGSALIWLLGRSWRITVIGQEKVEAVWKQNKRVCYALWHGRLLVLTYTQKKQKIHVLVSQHRDGEFIARIISRLGFVAVRGSSTRGGIRGALELVKASSHFDIAITPDGPKGPRHKVQPGAAFISSRAGIPLVPMTSSARSAWYLKSWDRFMIPKPFSRVLVLIGEPIWVTPESGETELRIASFELENRLMALTEEAEKYFLGS